MDKNVQDLLERRYFLRDEHNNLIERSWADVVSRVVNNIAQAETSNQDQWAKKFGDAMYNMEFLPSSPCLFNAGTQSQQLSSCFVVDIDDNIESIFNTVAECAKIFQRCGGAGFNIGKLRPKGSLCRSSGGKASGVISFMKIFDSVVEEVKQSGKRKGALKVDLPVDHPEIFDFIHCKDDTTRLTNMNISVSITNTFMEAVENDAEWYLTFNGEIYNSVKARDLWNELMTAAWKTGEPGISYQDNMDAGNMNPHLSKNVYGNPCHEFVNIPYSSCNLASVNLAKCVIDGKLDKEKLIRNVKLTFRFLDDMVTMNKLPLPKIEEITCNIRPIGLGTMGLADLLYELQIPYNSQKSLKFVDDLYGSIYDICYQYNHVLAGEKGIYPQWKGSKWDIDESTTVRCSSMLSIAPNGSIAIIAGTTGGIEPEFALVYERVTTDGAKYFMLNQVFKKYLESNSLYNDDMLKKIIDNHGSIQGMTEFPKNIQKIFVTASDISADWHVKVLAAVQKHVDLSISKTINLPQNASVEDVANVYMTAGKLGIKGLTVYRDGSREGQVLSTTNNTKKPNVKPVYDSVKPVSRKKLGKLTGTTDIVNVACGNLYITVNKDKDGSIVETFMSTSKSGVCRSNIDGLNRMISLGLRCGIKVDEIIDQLSAIKCNACTKFKGDEKLSGLSCPDCIAKRLREEYQNEFSQSIDINSETKQCPECYKGVHLLEGCVICNNCGWSKCG